MRASSLLVKMRISKYRASFFLYIESQGSFPDAFIFSRIINFEERVLKLGLAKGIDRHCSVEYSVSEYDHQYYILNIKDNINLRKYRNI